MIQHSIDDIDVRRTVFEFGGCFLAGSIAGGSLRAAQSTPVALKLSQSLKTFSCCVHDNQSIFSDCRTTLLRVGNSAEDILAPAGRVACAIASASLSGEIELLRNISSVIAKVIDASLVTRQRYHQLFEPNQNDDVRTYNRNHRNGSGLGDTGDEYWLTESQHTGEFSPRRPQVRPLLDFGSSSKKKNSRTCRKNYLKSDSRSSGIFSVQCVCRHPKLIVISVMRECEGANTALSVFLSRFKNLLWVCYCNNACNMCKSVTLRCP